MHVLHLSCNLYLVESNLHHKDNQTDHLLEFHFEFNLTTAAFDKLELRLTFRQNTEYSMYFFINLHKVVKLV